MRARHSFLGLLCMIVGLLSTTSCTPSPDAQGEADATESFSATESSITQPVAESENESSTGSGTGDVEHVKPESVPPKSNVGTSAQADTSEVTDITFEDIALPIDKDMVFRPIMMTERAQSLAGQRVRISGFMLADAKTRGVKQFILVKNTECKFGPGGQADHLVNVKVNIKNGVVHRTEAVSVEGVITINPYTGFDGNTWSIFDLACDRIEKFRPRR